MPKLERSISAVCLLLLTSLWLYAAMVKLQQFDGFKRQMAVQPLQHQLTQILPYLLPALELGIVLLLIFPASRKVGYLSSAVLLLLFSVYVGLALQHYFANVPCACGGIIGSLGWKGHFLFNLFFLLLSISGIYLTDRERRTRLP